MHLYLVQHAQSKSESEDPARPLTEEGMRTISKIAEFAKKLNIQVEVIRHSTKLRAKQTAEILGKHLSPPRGLVEMQGIGPNDDISQLKEKLRNMKENMMLVGHLPFLSKLASSLLSGDETRKIIEFQMGGIVRLDKDEKGVWSIRWILVPEMMV